MKTQPKIDAVDIKILKALLRDVRTNFADIAKECNLSTTAITQRYRKMKQNGIITGTTLITNPKNSRNQHFTSIDIKAESSHETSIIEAIKKLPRTRVCFKVIGKYDIHASMIIESLEQIDQIKNNIKKQKGVLKIEITMGLCKFCSFPENLSLTPTKRC
jgi:DNA-binding Lrp family transcriptional regulator